MKQKVYRDDVTKTIYYNSITAEFKKMRLTAQQVADLLGISRSALNHRIKADSPSIHWITYGLSNYFESMDNLQERDL